MQMNGFTGGIYKLSEWVMKLAYVNILWIIFSILGVIIFGFFPATTAMFVVVRKWLMGDDEVSVFRTFWGAYKKEFVKSNILGMFIILLGYVLYANIAFFKNTNGVLSLAYYLNIVVSLGYVLTLLYVFPTFVHYDAKVLQVFKNSFFIMIMNPIATTIMVVGGIAVYLLVTTVPGLIPVFSGSALSFVVMWAAFFAFSRIESKQKAASLTE